VCVSCVSVCFRFVPLMTKLIFRGKFDGCVVFVHTYILFITFTLFKSKCMRPFCVLCEKSSFVTISFSSFQHTCTFYCKCICAFFTRIPQTWLQFVVFNHALKVHFACTRYFMLCIRESSLIKTGFIPLLPHGVHPLHFLLHECVIFEHTIGYQMRCTCRV
jgi:hypothetical protein